MLFGHHGLMLALIFAGLVSLALRCPARTGSISFLPPVNREKTSAPVDAGP
jgi:hypothetical protein